MADIQQIAENKWTLNNGRGTELTLVHKSQHNWWEVYSQNAMTQAWRDRFGGVKIFNTLAEVEQHYKSLRGISALLNRAENSAVLTRIRAL